MKYYCSRKLEDRLYEEDYEDETLTIILILLFFILMELDDCLKVVDGGTF